MSCYDWPVHMAEKTWVQSEQFIEAYNKALELLAGKYEPAADPVKLDLNCSKSSRTSIENGFKAAVTGVIGMKMGGKAMPTARDWQRGQCHVVWP
jgi:hypothetical protein